MAAGARSLIFAITASLPAAQRSREKVTQRSREKVTQRSREKATQRSREKATQRSREKATQRGTIRRKVPIVHRVARRCIGSRR